MTVKVEGISCERLSLPLLNQISFQVEKGEVLQVKGPNGSGKSTLLRTLAGFLKPREGSIFLSSSPAFLGHKNDLIGGLSVRENLGVTNTIHSGNRRIDDVLNRFKIMAYEDHLVDALSAGQQRRVALANLMFKGKDIWILDEPTNSLDQNWKRWFDAFVQDEVSLGKTIIFATHQHHDILNLKTIDLEG